MHNATHINVMARVVRMPVVMNECLADLLQDQLRDLYDAESQYGGLLPRMVESVTHPALREFLVTTEQQTQENLDNLARVCSLLGVQPDGVNCEAMEGLIREARRSASRIVDSATLDAAIIANAQRIAHYEIAGFGTASAFARCLDATEASALLGRLAEGAGTRDQALTKIALGGWFEPGVNQEAATA
jgi:ferritin-like metal-binding protein YciE